VVSAARTKSSTSLAQVQFRHQLFFSCVLVFVNEMPKTTARSQLLKTARTLAARRLRSAKLRQLLGVIDELEDELDKQTLQLLYVIETKCHMMQEQDQMSLTVGI
jgi:hypothetical protein